jgi:hypothetical protein
MATFVAGIFRVQSVEDILITSHMQKQKSILISFIFFVSSLASAGSAYAYGGATVFWTAPTTDQGGGTLSGLSGYRVYYGTEAIDCTSSGRWNAASQSARQADAGTGILLPLTFRSITGGSTINYTFNNTIYLTPGTTYNFAVVATDPSGNLSNCAVTSGSATYVSKNVTYSADINVDHSVDYLDYGLFHPYFNTSNSSADFDRSGTADYLDYGIMHADYGSHF